MHTTRYTEQQFIDAVKNSYSIAQVLTKLNLAPKGGNYATVNRNVKRLGLDTSHMTGQAWMKGQTPGPKRDIQLYLSNQVYISSTHLRERLLSENIKIHQCESCLLTEWMNQPISLELHHIDGIRENNSLDNIQLLCPNCHAQTDNYRGKNISK